MSNPLKKDVLPSNCRRHLIALSNRIWRDEFGALNAVDHNHYLRLRRKYRNLLTDYFCPQELHFLCYFYIAKQKGLDAIITAKLSGVLTDVIGHYLLKENWQHEFDVIEACVYWRDDSDEIVSFHKSWRKLIEVALPLSADQVIAQAIDYVNKARVIKNKSKKTSQGKRINDIAAELALKDFLPERGLP